MVGSGKGHLARYVVNEGMPYHHVKEEIDRFKDLVNMTNRWGWTPEEIRGLSEDERVEYHNYLSGVILGEHPQK